MKLPLASVTCALIATFSLVAQVPDARAIYTWPQGYYSGHSPVMILEDFDSDGFDEILLSDSINGRITVMSGRHGVPVYATVARGQSFGISAALIPDQNADGRDDLAVGAPSPTGNGGAVYLMNPLNGAILRTLTPPAGASQYGYWLDRTDDFDGDGLDDLLVTDPSWRVAGSPRGAVFVYSSRNWAPVLFLLGNGGSFGFRAMDVGDRDADGKPEVVVSAPDFDEVRVFSGLTSQQVMQIPRPFGGTRFFGWSLDVANLDGDSVLDLVISCGSHFTATPVGCIAYSGSNGGVLWSDTFQYSGSSSRVGHAVKRIADHDHDTLDDILVGDRFTGWVRCRSGATGVELFGVSNQPRAGSIGANLASGGDVNGDGYEDFVVGTSNAAAAVFSMEPLSLVTDRQEISYAQLTQQRFVLRTGAMHAGKTYVVLGSISGIAPGIPTPAGVLPLNYDWYLELGFANANFPPFLSFRSVLDSAGSSAAYWQPLPGYPEAVGLRFDHAFVVLGATDIDFVSNSVPLTIVP